MKNSFVVVPPLDTAVYFMLEIISKILKNKYAGPLDWNVSAPQALISSSSVRGYWIFTMLMWDTFSRQLQMKTYGHTHLNWATSTVRKFCSFVAFDCSENNSGHLQFSVMALRGQIFIYIHCHPCACLHIYFMLFVISFKVNTTNYRNKGVGDARVGLRPVVSTSLSWQSDCSSQVPFRTNGAPFSLLTNPIKSGDLSLINPIQPGHWILHL